MVAKHVIIFAKLTSRSGFCSPLPHKPHLFTRCRDRKNPIKLSRRNKSRKQNRETGLAVEFKTKIIEESHPVKIRNNRSQDDDVFARPREHALPAQVFPRHIHRPPTHIPRPKRPQRPRGWPSSHQLRREPQPQALLPPQIHVEKVPASFVALDPAERL